MNAPSAPHKPGWREREDHIGLLAPAFDSRPAVLLNVRSQHHRAAADRALLDEVLMTACRNVEGNEDLLVAGVAEIPALDLRRSCLGAMMVTVAGVVGHRFGSVGVVRLFGPGRIIEHRGADGLAARDEARQDRPP